MSYLKSVLFATLLALFGYSAAFATESKEDTGGEAEEVILLPPVNYDPPPKP